MEYVNLENERERKWRLVFEENNGRVEDAKKFLHDNRWVVYMNEKENIIQGGYQVKFVGYDRNKVLWEAVTNHVVD